MLLSLKMLSMLQNSLNENVDLSFQPQGNIDVLEKDSDFPKAGLI